jgi:predicted RND superfamily exporter protein
MGGELMTWVERVFFRVGSYSVRHPWRILLVAALAAAGSLWAIATRLELRTSNLDLVDPAQPTVRRFLEFAGRFGTPNLLVIVLEGTDSASLREAVNRVAPGVRRIPEVRQVLDILPLRLDPKSGESRGGYITSEDGRMYFILVQPTDPYSRASSIEPMVRGVRQVMAGSRLEELAVRAGLTGMPEYALHDRDVVRRDITWLSGISFALIAVMFFACFRSVRRPLLAMGVLVLGVVLCLGVVSFYPGHLTLLSASFASILFGLGIDYGIHLISRLEEGVAAGLSDREVLPEAMAAIGRSLLTGCLTTALVLFSLQFSGFRGFAELGFIAGLGVVLCLVVMVTVLPAGLVLFQPRAPAAEWDPPRLGRWLVHLPYRSWGRRRWVAYGWADRRLTLIT